MKLYNMDKDEWRKGKFRHGDFWRSTVAYKCRICHVKTNEWHMGGYPGMGPKLLCPGDRYKEHDQIESAIKKLFKIRNNLKDGKEYSIKLKHLEEEEKLFSAKIKRLRKLFLKLDDVKGKISKVEDYYPVTKYYEKEKLS